MKNKAYCITNPEIGKQLEYQHLGKDPKTRPTWDTPGANEFGRLIQCIGTGDKNVKRVQGTNIIFSINKKNMPLDCMTTYAKFVCANRDEKEEKNRTRLTVGRNPITGYEGDITTVTAGLGLIKMHW